MAVLFKAMTFCGNFTWLNKFSDTEGKLCQIPKVVQVHHLTHRCHPPWSLV